jgi:hypothetical protein
MLRVHANSSLSIAGCALIVVAAGCVSPLSAPFAKPERKTTNARATTGPAVPSATTGAMPGTSEPSAADMAGVMDKVAQVRDMDPAAEQKLLDELKRTPPNTWPLVAEQFRASLALHQQLAAKPTRKEEKGDPMAAFHRASSKSQAPDAADKKDDLSYITSLTATNRPSAAIGSLVDPREKESSAEPIAAHTVQQKAITQVGLVSAADDRDGTPAEFSESGPMYPIAAQRDEAARPAAFDAGADGTPHVATQALGRDEPENAPRRLPQPASAEVSTAIKRIAKQPSSGSEDWQHLVDEAADDLSQRVATSPRTTAEVHQHVSLRLLRLLAGNTEKALEPIPHIPPAEQDYWSRQIFAIATYLDHHSQPDDKRRAAASVSHLDEAVSHLRELGALSLRNLSFCKNVYGYGAYDPYDTDVFAVGQQVSLYVEVENYHSSSSEKGYCTLLGATYELLDEKGKRVSGGDFPDVDDCCRSRRRDFHIQFGLTLPENLTPGRYRLELVVKDRQSDKLGHATAPFEIRSGRK